MVNESKAPVLETERLWLKPPEHKDFPPYAAMWALPEVTREISGKPLSEEEAWTRFLRNAGLWPVLGYGYWHVFERDGGAFVGQVGFADFRRALTPPLTGMPEIGWVIAPAHHGKGYASEAALAAVQWGDENFSAEAMCCIIGVNNAPSIRIAEKCGFSFVVKVDYHASEINIYRRYVAS